LTHHCAISRSQQKTKWSLYIRASVGSIQSPYLILQVNGEPQADAENQRQPGKQAPQHGIYTHFYEIVCSLACARWFVVSVLSAGVLGNSLEITDKSLADKIAKMSKLSLSPSDCGEK